ncbi:MAG: DUF4340 domain-containing protein [Spirochaetales bacterium]|jgi:hypothetical protein|nr:DUF4340 domain-containing protein [Spirochaetales bacterium]
MKYKTKILSLCLLAAGLGLSLALGAFYSYRGSESRSARPLSSFLKTGTVNRLVFQNGGETQTLTAGSDSGKPLTAGKSNRSWTVLINDKPFPAAAAKAGRFFELLDEASLSPAVTENSGNWGRFGLEDTAEKRVSISGASGEAEILLGKEDEAGRGQYIRFAGSSAVYLVSQSFSYYAERDSAYWSELRIFPASLKASDIAAIQASGKDVSYSLYRDRRPEGLAWIAEGSPDKNLDQGKTDSLAASVSQIAAKSFAADAESSSAGLDSPDVVITLTASNQTRYELRLSRADEAGNRYCEARINAEPRPYIYLLDSYTAGKILSAP